MAKKNNVNTFNEGLSMDMAKDVSKTSVITDANNAVIVPKGGETYELQNMKGNELAAFLPEGHFPKAIEVFNGIAYIVSNKYNDEGEYQYTEIGTYPSPEWSVLFPEKVNVVTDFDNTTIENLSDVINTAISQGEIDMNTNIQTVYSFEVKSFYFPLPDLYMNQNMFMAQYSFWYGLADGVDQWGKINSIYIQFEIYDSQTDQLVTNTYADHVAIDMITINRQDSINGVYGIDSAKTDNFIVSEMRLYKKNPYGYVLRVYNSDTGQMSLNQSYRDDMIRRTHGNFRFDDIFDTAGSGYQNYEGSNSNDVVFIVKCDSYVKKHIYFKVSAISPDAVDGDELNHLWLYTKAGNYTGAHIGGSTNFNNAIDAWVDNVNQSTINKEYGRSKIIFARQRLNVNVTDNAECSFYGNLSNKKHYVAFRPIITSRLHFNQDSFHNYSDFYDHLNNELGMTNVSDNICNKDKALIYEAATTNTTPTFNTSHSQTHFDRLSNIKIYKDSDTEPFSDKSKGIMNTYTSIFPDNDKYIKYSQSQDEQIIIELDQNNLGDDYFVCYYQKMLPTFGTPDDTDIYNNDIGYDIGYIFDNYFKQFDDDGMEMPAFDLTDLNINSRSKFDYINVFINNSVYNVKAKGYIMEMWLTRLPVIALIPGVSMLQTNNGKEYFENLSLNGNSIISKVNDYKDVLPDINQYNLDAITYEDTQITLYTCSNDGESADLHFDIGEPCCNDNIKKNVLITLRFNIPNIGSNSSVKLLFSSVYSYTGSIFGVYDSNSTNNEITLLFASVPMSPLTINVISDVSNILSDVVDSMYIRKGYAYCLEDKYSHLQDRYCPLFNFNADVDISDIYLLDSQNSNYAFRSNLLVKDTDTDYELLIEPNYDSTVNLILNDKQSKVKLINSRFAYDPSNNRCFIPQKYGFNDDNTYSNRNILNTELIRRFSKILDVKFDTLLLGGELFAGNYTYYFRYLDSDGNTTDVVNHTLPISVFNVETDSMDNVGEIAGRNTNASVRLLLSNFDRSYKNIEISFSYSAGEQSASKSYFKIKKLYSIPLSDELVIVHAGLEDLEKLEVDDISKYYNHHEAIGSITQGKDRLVLANEKLSDVAIYSEIQKLALDVKIKEKDLVVEESEGFYKDAYNIYNKTGFWRGETYQIGIELSLKNGGVSPIFNFRGHDNIGGNAIYSTGSGMSINEFVGSYGENGYGIYRTSLRTPIVISAEDNINGCYNHIHIVSLYLDGLREFLDSDIVKSISNGFTIVRKERVDDVFLEGYVTPAFEVPFGSGLVLDKGADSTNGLPAISQGNHAYVTVNKSPSLEDVGISGNNYATKIHIAPFGIIQMYIGDDSSSDPYDNYHGYVKGSFAEKHKLNIFNALINQSANDKFGFISADLIADSEHYAADFQGKGKYFSVNRDVVEFRLGNRNESSCSFTSSIGIPMTIDKTNTYAAICRLKSHVKLDNMVMSGNTETMYIPEKVDTSTENSFASKLDQTNINFYTLPFIGATEGDAEFSVSELLRSYNGNYAYGYLSRIYHKSEGPLSLDDWATLYSSKYQEGGYFPITPRYNISQDLALIENNTFGGSNDLTIYGGDCFINKVYIRTLTKNGLDDNFDNYSNIWDYIGGVNHHEFTSKEFNKDNPAANSWLEDSEYMALKRARLVPKGMWVEVIHESKNNLALRTTEYNSAEEKFKYNKDRTFLSSLNRTDTYIPAEISSSQMDSKGYNKGYSDSSGAVLNYNFNDVEKLLRVFYARVEVSDISVKGALKNGYRELYGLNYKDYATQYGYISKVLSFNDTVFAVFERAIAYIPLMEKTQVSNADGGVFIDNANILGKSLTILSGTNGSIHPDSVITTKTGCYLYDHNNNNILQFVNGAMPKDITAYTIETFLVEFRKKLEGLRKESDKYISYNVKANYDVLTGDITFTFYIYESSKVNLPDNCDLDIYEEVTPNSSNLEFDDICTVKYENEDGCEYYLDDISLDGVNPLYTVVNSCENIPKAKAPFKILYQSSIYYNERLAKWVSPISFNPNFVFALNDKTFSMNLIENQNRIFMHRSSKVNYCFFYDEQHNFSFEFVVNQNQYAQKILENLMIVSNERVPVTISYDVDSKRSLIDDFNSNGDRVRNQYNLDLVQDVKTRRFEVKIIGLSFDTDMDIFLNTNDEYIYEIQAGYQFTIGSDQYRIVSITPTLTDEGIEMPRLSIEYLAGGMLWIDVHDLKGTYMYEQIFGYTLRISEVSIINSNSDYIEDHMWVQVQLKETEDGWREVRDRSIKIKVNYDGIDKTFIHSIVSTVDESLN